MTDYNNGQIYGWNGGECPVHPETVVRVWFRSWPSQEKKALTYFWTHGMEFDDIIAFQVVKPYVEPKVIWVNEYTSGNAVFTSEEAAKKQALSWAKRIAVKYVEAVNEKDAPHD